MQDIVHDVNDVITRIDFGEDRLRGLGMAMDRNLGFSMEFCGRHYNTLALLCECVSNDFVVSSGKWALVIHLHIYISYIL